MFLIIGWSGLLLLPDIYKINPNLIWFILLGGISYSIGVVFYSISKVKYFHFIWHFWVLFGTILHFFGIYLYIL
jgi:hemolysin III